MGAEKDEPLLRFGRETASMHEHVVNVAETVFGFERRHVVPLESDGRPRRYCMFEVCGVQYQVRDGRISVYGQGE